MAPRLLVAIGLAGMIGLATGCASPRLDEPSKVRHTEVPLYGLFNYSTSEDGSSYRWAGPLGLVGQDVEAERRQAWILPFWWSTSDPPYYESTLVFPLYYGRTAVDERWQFFSILYGYIDKPESRTDCVLWPLFDITRSKTEDFTSSNLLFVYDWQHRANRKDFTLVPILGLAHAAKFQWGFPAAGETVPSLGRTGSRRFELLNVFGLVTLFGYDDVGDRREFRVLTLLSSEVLSPIRSWRGRGEDPFVREWVFPFYMNVADLDGGWYYVGPLWGGFHDTLTGHDTTWVLLGLVSRTATPDGASWRLLGIPIT